MAIYLDENATSLSYQNIFHSLSHTEGMGGNPSSIHALGRKSRALIHTSREELGKFLNINPENIIFTSGGSEANALIIFGMYLYHLKNKKNFKLLTSRSEHSSVYELALFIQSLPLCEVVFVQHDRHGSIILEDFRDKLMSLKPHLVSIMTVNNETGALMDLANLYQLVQKYGAFFHTDSVQALMKTEEKLWLFSDAFSLSAHKIGGLQGTGALILKNPSLNETIEKYIFGGAQEMNRRGGTENLAGILSFGQALTTHAPHNKDPKNPAANPHFPSEHLKTLQMTFEEKLLTHLPHISIASQKIPRIYTTSNICFKNIRGEVLVSLLDLDGIYASTGSACSSGSIRPSRVLLEMGYSKEEARSSVRLSWSKHTTLEDLLYAAEKIIWHVKKIQKI